MRKFSSASMIVGSNFSAMFNSFSPFAPQFCETPNVFCCGSQQALIGLIPFLVCINPGAHETPFARDRKYRAIYAPLRRLEGPDHDLSAITILKAVLALELVGV